MTLWIKLALSHSRSLWSSDHPKGQTTVIPVKSLDWPDTAPERALTLPARYFYDEEIFKAERERIFYPAWHCVGHVSELAEPGQFLTFDILDQTIVVLRGDDGQIRAFHNVCQHRGNRLLEARRGKLGSVLRCGYHSWCYGRDGSLQKRAALGAAAGLRPQGLRPQGRAHRSPGQLRVRQFRSGCGAAGRRSAPARTRR